MRIGSLILLIWLIIGAVAGGQRGYYTGSIASCTRAGTIAVTIIAGPLNYFGVNPKITCTVPQPSKSPARPRPPAFAPGPLLASPRARTRPPVRPPGRDRYPELSSKSRPTCPLCPTKNRYTFWRPAPGERPRRGGEGGSGRTMYDTTSRVRGRTGCIGAVTSWPGTTQGGTVTMRGAIIYAPGDVRVEQREDPKISEPTDAVIRLAATCVCGSDLWSWRGIDPVTAPHPIGHEYVGVVEEVGRDVRTIKPGRFVVGSFFASDNTCEICLAGYQSRCVHAELIGANGAQAEYLRVRLPRNWFRCVLFAHEPRARHRPRGARQRPHGHASALSL